MGAEIRKEKVTPKGTPAVTKPMKSGTAEQEQKGVTMPRPAARTLAMPSGSSREQHPRAFGRERGVHHAHDGDDAREQEQDLGRVVEEEHGAADRCGMRRRWDNRLGDRARRKLPLLEAARRGDAHALEELLLRYQPHVYLASA